MGKQKIAELKESFLRKLEKGDGFSAEEGLKGAEKDWLIIFLTNL